MKKTTTWLFVVSVLMSVSVAVVPLNAKEGEAGAHKGGDAMTEKLKNQSGAQFEKQFLQLMIEHHKEGIDMAQMAVQKAKSGELKGLSEKSMAAQRRDIEQMTGWLKQWHQAEPTPAVVPEASKEKMQKDKAKLEKAEGEEFDRTFLSLMSKHHKGAVSMSELAKEKAQHDEVKQFAEKLIAEQTKEIKEMKQMREKMGKGGKAE